MVAGSFTEEYESPIALERLWKAGVLDAYVLIPKLLPEIITGVEIVGDVVGAGTIAQFNFNEAVTGQKLIRDHIDVLDSENHIFRYTVIDDGGLLLGSRLKSYSYEFKLEAAGGGCKGNVTVDYDTVGDGSLTSEEVRKLTSQLLGMVKAVEAFLQANPDQYA